MAAKCKALEWVRSEVSYFISPLHFYRVVQLNFTLEIEVFYMLFERDLKQNIENFHFRYKIQFDHLVRYLCGQHNYILDKISLNIVM